MSYSTILGQKEANVCKLLECAHLTKIQPVNANRRKIKRATIGLSRILFFFILTHKTQNFDFFTNKCLPKIKKNKTGIYVVNLLTSNIHAKFQSNIIIFGCAMAKNPDKGDDVTFFKMQFWAFLIAVCENK